jgi:hypothetical protein
LIAPNKAVPIEQSALGLAGVVLACGPDPIDLLRLYHTVAHEFETIDQFLLTLDVLYVLERIDLDPLSRTVTYAT